MTSTIDHTAVRAAIANADRRFNEAVEPLLERARAAVDEFAAAELQHLGDFALGRAASAAAEAWDRLVAAREQLEQARAAAEQVRQAEIAAALVPPPMIPPEGPPDEGGDA